MKEAANFFLKLMNAPVERIAVENPLINGMAQLPKHDQIIQPYYFGQSVSKRTCLWLKNLPKLVPTNIVDKGAIYKCKNGKSRGSEWFMRMPIKDRAKNRSKTFQGIADAMADQWGQLSERKQIKEQK